MINLQVVKEKDKNVYFIFVVVVVYA